MTSGIFGPCSCTPEPSVYIPAAGANCITGKQESIFRRLNVLLKLRWPSIFGRAQVHFEANVPLWPVQHQRHFQEWISESCDFCLKNKLPLRQCKWLWVANLESLSERIGHLSLPHQQIPQVFHPQQAWEACTDVVLQVKVIDKLDSDPACASSCASNDPPERKSSMLHNFTNFTSTSIHQSWSPQVLSLPLLAWPFQRDQSLPHDPQSRINFNVSLSNMTTIKHMAPFTVPYSHRGPMHLHILVSLMSQETFAKSWKTWCTWSSWFYIPMEGKGRAI